MDSKKIKLEYAIPIPNGNGKDIQCSVITLGRLQAGHLKLLPENYFSRKDKSLTSLELIPLVAGLADIPLSAAEKIDVVVDLPVIAEALGNFLS